MSQCKRAALTLTIMFFGWCLMGLAYDKPQWQFEAAGIIGVLAVLGALGWWVYDAPSAIGWKRKDANEHRFVG